MQILELNITLTHSKLNINFCFPNTSDTNEDVIPLGQEGMTQDA